MPCSFCNSPLHNIANCNNQMISVYHENIKQIYLNIMALNNSIEYSENFFRMILNASFYVKDLRAVGVRYLHVYASTSKSTLISILWEYFHNSVVNVNLQHQATPQNNTSFPFPIPHYNHTISDNHPEESSILSYINNLNSYVGYNMTADPHNLNSDFNSEFILYQNKKYKISINLVEDNDENEKKLKNFEDCAICYDNVSCMDFVKLNCNHEFCGCCIKNTFKYHNETNNPSCAMCRQPMVCFTVKNVETYNLIAEHCF